MANTGVTDAAAVIQETVSSIVLETLIQESVMMGAVEQFQARPGEDTIKLPRFSALSVVSKSEDTALTAAAPTIGTDDLSLDQHRAIPFFLEEIANVQSMVDILGNVVANAARSHAADVDDLILSEGVQASASAPDHVLTWTGDFGGATAATRAQVIKCNELLNLQNVPRSSRFLIVSPQFEADLLNIDDFIHADKYGSSEGLMAAELGRIFNFRVLMSNSSELQTLGTGSAFNGMLAMHRSHVAYAMQQGARLDSLYKPLEVGTEYALTRLDGAVVRDSGKRGVLVIGE